MEGKEDLTHTIGEMKQNADQILDAHLEETIRYEDYDDKTRGRVFWEGDNWIAEVKEFKEPGRDEWLTLDVVKFYNKEGESFEIDLRK